MANIKFRLNGEEVTYNGLPTMRLLDVLRLEYHFVGVKEGCGEGECGACAVLLDGNIVNSCQVPMGSVADHEIMTIEGYAKTKQYQFVKEGFSEAGAVQCGFCTPGMIIATESLLRQNPHPSEAQIREGLSGNLCRCTGYNMIVDAVKKASKDGDGSW